MDYLFRILSAATVAIKRLLAQRGLALATLLGLTVAVSLTMGIPLYAEAVYYRVLSEGLFSDTPHNRGMALRPPVAFLFRYVGSFTGPIQWETLQTLDLYLGTQVYRDLGLAPSSDAVGARMFNTGLFGIFAEEDADQVTEKPPLFSMSLATIGDLATHLAVVEGRLPTGRTGADEAVEVLLSRAFADEMGTQVDEVLIAYDFRAMRRYEANPAKFSLHVVGIWEPANPHAEFWEYTQIPRENLLFVSEDTFAGRISPAMTDEIYQAMWYLPMDASSIYVSDVAPLLGRILELQKRVQGFLPNTTLDVSPSKVLSAYQRAANTLTVLLFAYSVPIVSLVLTFVVLIAALSAERHRNEVATLRSRGATSTQVVSITVLEGALLGGLALAAALPVSLLLAYSIGQTRSFLDFSLATDLRVGLTWGTARFGLITVVLVVGALVLPVVGLARQTIVTYKQERARTLRPPLWQRAWLDVLLLIPVGYGTYILSQQGSVLPSASDVPTEPFQDPLLFLVPAFGLCALTLLSLRLLPLVTRVLAWLSGQTRGVGFVLALRQLARAPRIYAAPLGLLILTLSLSTYTASLSATLDSHLHDQQYYWVGADASLIELGDNPEAVSGFFSAAPAGQDDTFWRFPPVSDYVALAGVRGATRVGRYEARVQSGQSFVPGTFIGVDRADLARVAYWRDDFASESLGALMNRLALVTDGVLLSSGFMRTHGLEVGDTVNVVVRGFDYSVGLTVQIVGRFDLFPSWYPETGPLLVGSLDYFFDEAQLQLPYRVWLKTDPDVDYDQLAKSVFQVSLGAQGVLASRPRILEEQRKPERQGLFGLLSVGFGAAAVLAALGFLLYALSLFQRRAVELGVLRAIGMSTWQMAVLVVCEQGFVLLVGGAVGTGLGVWASRVYIPFLQIGAEAISRVPPFVVEVPWSALLRVYVLFGALFVFALAALIRSLWRMKVFQAIKLGETL